MQLPSHSTRTAVPVPGGCHLSSLSPKKGLSFDLEMDGLEMDGVIRSPGPSPSAEACLLDLGTSRPSVRVSSLRAGQLRKGDRCQENIQGQRERDAHPSPTTYNQTDSRDRLAALSSPVQPRGTFPHCHSSPSRPPALRSSHWHGAGHPSLQHSFCEGGTDHCYLPRCHAQESPFWV